MSLFSNFTSDGKYLIKSSVQPINLGLGYSNTDLTIVLLTNIIKIYIPLLPFHFSLIEITSNSSEVANLIIETGSKIW